MFITFEGIDGSGKSTQVALLVETLASLGFEVVRLREPGGTDLSEKVRGLLLDPSNTIDPAAELMLYEAARAQLVAERIRPALARGAMVVCDRFHDSTTAYQWAGRGLDLARVTAANELGCQGLVPDLTIILDLDPALAFSRACATGMDRMEAAGLGFQERVRDGYRAIACREADRIHMVDASGTPEEVRAIVEGIVVAQLSNHGRIVGGSPSHG